MNVEYDRLYNRHSHADPLLALGRLAGGPGPRRRRSPVRDGRRPHARRRSLARAPAPVPAGPPASGGSADAGAPRSFEAAPAAAAARARPLRSRLRTGEHQEEARRHHPEGTQEDWSLYARHAGLTGHVAPVLARRVEPRRFARAARPPDGADAVDPREPLARPKTRASGAEEPPLQASRAHRSRAGPARRAPPR